MTLPASVNGLGQTDGLDLWIQDLNGQGQDFLDSAFRQLQAQSKIIQLSKTLISSQPIVRQILILRLTRNKALANGLQLSAINNTLSSAWGGTYVNDFIDRGRIKRVMIQGDAEFRSKPEDLYNWSVRNDQNEMVPFFICQL